MDGQPDRVYVREHIPEDEEAYIEWQTNPEVGTYLSWLPRSREESIASLRDAIVQQSSPSRERFFFAIVLVDSGTVIGDVGFTILSPGLAGCGWFIRRRFWNLGYATEAAVQMLERAFTAAGVRKIVATCAVPNTASASVMKKCGFSLSEKTDARLSYELGSKGFAANGA